jgi:hypothetical protein
MRLLRLDPGGVQKLLDEMEKDCSDIKKNALSLAWYMRGGISYEDALNMSMEERIHINELIESNLDITKKSQLPFF